MALTLCRAAKRLVDHMVVPILHLAKVEYTVRATERRRHAVEIVESLGELRGV